jgi:protein-tyrosine phosphatase
MPTRIDFHSHILPGLDHGSRKLETSLKQLELIQNGGTEVVVASSHFYPARMNLEDFHQRRRHSLAQFRPNLTENHPKIALGAEVACYPGLQHMDGLETLCIAGTDCMLLEMPMAKWNSELFETVDAITERGIQVVLAHIDRYDQKDVEELMTLDVMAQINASSLGSFFRRRKLLHWFTEGRVWALGSDLHGAEDGGYDHFLKAIDKLGENTVAAVMANSAALLEGAKFLTQNGI